MLTERDPTESLKQLYADRCFSLPVEQIKLFPELTAAQMAQVLYYFGNAAPNNFVYAVKQDGNLVSKRERKRPERGPI